MELPLGILTVKWDQSSWKNTENAENLIGQRDRPTRIELPYHFDYKDKSFIHCNTNASIGFLHQTSRPSMYLLPSVQKKLQTHISTLSYSGGSSSHFSEVERPPCWSFSNGKHVSCNFSPAWQPSGSSQGTLVFLKCPWDKLWFYNQSVASRLSCPGVKSSHKSLLTDRRFVTR